MKLESTVACKNDRTRGVSKTSKPVDDEPVRVVGRDFFKHCRVGGPARTVKTGGGSTSTRPTEAEAPLVETPSAPTGCVEQCGADVAKGLRKRARNGRLKSRPPSAGAATPTVESRASEVHDDRSATPELEVFRTEGFELEGLEPESPPPGSNGPPHEQEEPPPEEGAHTTLASEPKHCPEKPVEHVSSRSWWSLLGLDGWRGKRQVVRQGAIAKAAYEGIDPIGEDDIKIEPVVGVFENILQHVDGKLGPVKHNVRHRSANRFAKNVRTLKMLIENLKFETHGFDRTEVDRRCLAIAAKGVVEKAITDGLVRKQEGYWFKSAMMHAYYIRDDDEEFLANLASGVGTRRA